MSNSSHIHSKLTMLILEHRWCLRLGAVIVVLAVALDPFSQQLVQLRQGVQNVEVLDGPRAMAARTEKFKKGGYWFFNYTKSAHLPGGPLVHMASTRMDMSMQGSILSGLSRPLGTVKQQVDVQCPGSSCTWPEFETLGVCHKCNDLTSDLRRVDDFGVVYKSSMRIADEVLEDNITAFALPNGHFLPNPDGIITMRGEFADDDVLRWLSGKPMAAKFSMTSFGTGDASKTNTMQDLDTLIWSTSTIHPDLEKIHGRGVHKRWITWPDVPVRATECALYYCVQRINTTVVGNDIRETATDAHAKRDPKSWQPVIKPFKYYGPENLEAPDASDSIEFRKKNWAIDHTDLLLHFPDDSSKPVYTLSQKAVKSISAYFQSLFLSDIFTGTDARAAVAKALGNDAVGFNGALNSYSTYPPAMENLWSWLKNNKPTANSFTQDVFAALAASMTNEMRGTGVANNTGSDSGSTDSGGSKIANASKGEHTITIYAGTTPEELSNIGTPPVLGMVEMPTTYYKAEWGWIALHAAVLLGGMVFWWMTTGHTTESGETVLAWKSSSLAVLGRGDALGGVLDGAETVKEMKKRAESERVVMVLGETSLPLKGGKWCSQDSDGTTILEEDEV